jgi:hypothetical protein
MEKKRNLWVIPTEKPTYLYEMEGKLHLSDKFEKGNDFWHNQNIYITSDEEIKVGYHVFNTKNNHYGGVVNKNNLSDARLLSYIKKIILTTDQDLIKDGVQAIDDEFLEWFVKNPSCDSVDIKTFRNPNGKIVCYKITIPQEEPKQETLEEASKRAVKSGLFKDETLFIAGVKWQQQQEKNKYSEEEVIVMINEFDKFLLDNRGMQGLIREEKIKQFFKQSKKK